MSYISDLSKELRSYERDYLIPPYGRAVEGTEKVLHRAADTLDYLENRFLAMQSRFVNGLYVHYEGDDVDDSIKCPFCGYDVARNDDFFEDKPNHCPQCGTKLLYKRI